MAFSRRFPRDVKGSPYPHWEELWLDTNEESKVESEQRNANIALMRECIKDAEKIFFEEEMKEFQSNIIDVAIALFEKRASHSVYWKEERAKQKFDERFHNKK